jgi:tripartite-type tricarboxylate transporter receptor subunit TctC
MMRLWPFSLAWLILCAACVIAPPAPAADFYQGKTLTVIVGYAPGGGVDATARAITRHLGEFIPGRPNIVVQNMEGAAGLVSVNYLTHRVAPDGLTLAVPGRSWYIEGIVKRAGANFDPTKLTYIGSPGAVSSAAFVRKATGVTSYDALKASSKTLTFGALGAGTPTAMVPKLLARSGLPIKVVLGYVSTARILLALEQGEIDGFYTVGNALDARADLAKAVVPILQTGTARGGVPPVRDAVRADDQAVLGLVTATDGIGVPVVGPAGMPADVTSILRKAFVAMAQDKAYQADAVKVELPIGAPIEGVELQARIGELVSTTTPQMSAAFLELSSKK